MRDRGAVGAQVDLLLTDAAADAQNVAVIVQHGYGSLSADLLIDAEIDGRIVGVVGVGGLARLQRCAFLVSVDGDRLLPVDRVAVLRDGQTGSLVVLHLVPTAGIRRIITQADRLLMPQGGDQVVLVVHRFFHALLNLGVHGGVDAQTAGEDQLLGLVLRVVQILLQLGQQLGVERIGEPGVAGRTGRVLGRGGAFHQRDGLGLRGFKLSLGDIPLGLHLVQNMVAALDEFFRVGGRVILGRVLGDGRQHRTLGEGQILDMLAEILERAGLHAVDDAGQRDRIEVCLKDGLLAVLVVQTQRTEDLAHLTHVVLLVIAGQVFDQLLLQRGGTAVGTPDAVAGEGVQRCADRTLEVDAGLGPEVLVLDGDDGIFQVVRHGGKLAPDAVFAAGQLVILVNITVIDDRGLLVFLVVQIERLGIICRDLHDIHGQQHAAHAGRHNAQAEHTADKA